MITGEWFEILKPEFKKDYYKDLYNFVKDEYNLHTVYPPADKIFSALDFTHYEKVKVVILGQDPYHNDNQACGLSFSVPESQKKLPPSLVNIYKELKDDLGIEISNNGNLESWAKQGVLLLNTVLTVQAHKAFSHRGKGWEQFTDAIIKEINLKDSPVVYLLWGNPAKAKEVMLNNPKHLVLKAAHPSPLSANNGFFGCRHFSKANKFLKENGLSEIDWTVKERNTN